MERRLYRNEHDKAVAGVCSGLADYMQMDVTVIRLMMVLLVVFAFGTGILVYIIMWAVLPVNNDPNARMRRFNKYYQDPNMFNSANAFNNAGNTDTNKWNTQTDPFMTGGPAYDPEAFKKKDNTARTIGGLAILIIGFYFLFKQLDLLPHWVRIRELWPLALIAVGISFIIKSKKDKEWEAFKANNFNQQDPIVTPPPADKPETENKEENTQNP